jgi:peptide/nickel transport system permease protein
LPARTLRLRSSQPERLLLPADFDAQGAVSLPPETPTRRILLRLAPGVSSEPPVLRITFALDAPAPMHRVLLEYQEPLPLLARFTQTIFFQRSLKMLVFQYGTSDDGKDIGREIMKRLGPSLSITVPAFVLGLLLEILVAMGIAVHRGTYVDYWGLAVCVLLMSISTLFYIMGGQVVLGQLLRLVPISGYDYGPNALKFIVLPVIIAVVAGLGGNVRFYRTIFLEEMQRDYVRTARAKGMPERIVLFVHALKNAMIPILTGVVVSLPFLFAGSLLLESFFAIPGMGSFMIEAIQRQDFAVVQALVSLGSFLYIVGLLLTDVSYTLVDPRVHLE